MRKTAESLESALTHRSQMHLLRAVSCRRFAANAVRLQLHALAYNLAHDVPQTANPSISLRELPDAGALFMEVDGTRFTPNQTVQLAYDISSGSWPTERSPHPGGAGRGVAGVHDHAARQAGEDWRRDRNSGST
jgi:hypothetical protein